LEKIACGDFLETLHGFRRQKAWFLPPAWTRSYAQGDFFETLHGSRPAKGATFAGLRGSR
jgi:hypothetical protein